MQLVSTLETALNEAERNLRKSRMQLNEYAKERDSHARTSDSLRQQLQAAFSDMEGLRENLAKAKQDSDSRLAAERQQRDAARVQLEARMEEMRARKSKLNVSVVSRTHLVPGSQLTHHCRSASERCKLFATRFMGIVFSLASY